MFTQGVIDELAHLLLAHAGRVLIEVIFQHHAGFRVPAPPAAGELRIEEDVLAEGAHPVRRVQVPTDVGILVADIAPVGVVAVLHQPVDG